MTTGKTIVLTIRTYASKVMSLLWNMLSRLVITFLPRSKHLISWLQSPSAVILEPKKIKSVTVSNFSPSICHEVMGPYAMILVFWMLSFKPAYLTAFQMSWNSIWQSCLNQIRAQDAKESREMWFLPLSFLALNSVLSITLSLSACLVWAYEIVCFLQP